MYSQFGYYCGLLIPSMINFDHNAGLGPGLWGDKMGQDSKTNLGPKIGIRGTNSRPQVSIRGRPLKKFSKKFSKIKNMPSFCYRSCCDLAQSKNCRGNCYIYFLLWVIGTCTAMFVAYTLSPEPPESPMQQLQCKKFKSPPPQWQGHGSVHFS
jgi:hypothetical protein